MLLMVLPIAFFAYSAGQVLKHRAEAQAIAEGADIARVSAGLVEEHLRDNTQFLESFATRPSFRQAWKDRNLSLIGPPLEQATSLRPDFVFVSVYDLDGTMRAIYPPEKPVLNRNFAYRDWYKGVARQWKPYVSEVYQTAVAPYQLVVATAVPIKDKDGKPIGILMATCTLEMISRRLPESNVEGIWTISLVDQNGKLAARPNIDSFAPAVDLSEYQPIKQVRAGRMGHGMFERNGTAFFASYEPVTPYGWGILVEQPLGALHQSVWLVERRVWILGLIFLTVGVGVAAFMASLYSQLETGNRFIDLSIDMFCIAGFDGFFKRVNPSFEKTLGFTIQELMAKPYLEFIHPDDRPATVAQAGRLQNRDVTFAFENRYLCKGGSYKWLLWNAVSVPEQALICAVARDITERKRAEELLQESEERHRKLFDNNPHPTWVYDRETLRFLAVNSAAMHKYGYSGDEFLTMTIFPYFSKVSAGSKTEMTAPALGDIVVKTEPSSMWRSHPTP
jgi:PAS domain S-box-containing protein